MKKTISIIAILTLFVVLVSGCSKQVEKPEVLKENEIADAQIEVEVENNNKITSINRQALSDKTIEMVETLKLEDEFYKNGYYGVPVNINDKYYSVPVIKVLNYYFVDLEVASKLFRITYEVKEKEIVLKADNMSLDLSSVSEGKLDPVSINTKEIKLLSDKDNLGMEYQGKHYISLMSLSDILSEDLKLYIDREMGIITNKKPDITNDKNTNNGLLRKSISLDDKHQLVVRDGTYGKMLVLYDIYGYSMDITPNNISFSTDLQNIFLHKNNDKIYMFGLMGNYVEVYEITVEENLSISIVSKGAVQRQAQNIYYINDKYIAVGRGDIFGINIGEDMVYENNLKTVVDTKESGGNFNIIDGNYYLTIKNNNDKISIYKMNFEGFKLELVKTLNLEISFENVEPNFMYSFVEDGQISIYAMDSTGYIYNIRYDVKTDETFIEQTDNFKLFYTEEKYPVELSIDLVRIGEEGQSELSFTVNGKYLGNNILVFGVEDNWVYCSEYYNDGDKTTLYGFRYNALTGVKDYSNAS